MPQTSGEPVADESSRLTAAGRVFAVLDVFRAPSPPLSLAEISRRAGLSMTTTHRLVHELLDWHAMERTDDGRFQLGDRLLELAAASGPGLHLRERALPALLRMHRMVRVMVVHLAVRDGGEAMYVESLRAAHGDVPSNRIGGRMPLHATATGRVLLAYADPAVQDAYLASPLHKYTRYTETDPAALRGEFEVIRQQRSLVTTRQVTENTGGVASPVFDRHDRVVAAVGIVLTLEEQQIEDYVDLVRSTAGQISRALERS